MGIEVYNLINKYGKTMISQTYSIGKEAQIYFKVNEKCYATRKGADFANLKKQDIKCLTEKEVEKDLRAEILMKSKKLNALVVSNTPYCAKSSRENHEILAVLDDMAQIIGPKAPLVNFNKKEISKALKRSAGCIVKDKYTITTGRTLYEAVVAQMVLEKSAEVFLKASVLGGGKKINKVEASLMRFIYKKKYSKAEEGVKASEINKPQDEELKSRQGESRKSNEGLKTELNKKPFETKGINSILNEEIKEIQIRELLAEYGRKLLECGLVQGTWGNLSIRLNQEFMIVTPSGTDYNRLTPQDMIKVNINTLKYEGNVKPTSEKDLHGSIYATRKDVGAVIHTHSKYCCIFAAAGKSMKIEDKEMESIFGRQVSIARYGLPGTKSLTKNTREALGENFGCFMANHGMIGCGEDMKTAFENCLKLEQCGEAYVESRYK